MKYYPFEMHTHTLHSDADFTPEELTFFAKENGLCGLAITDHNTVSGHRAVIEGGKKQGLIILPGIEWTTFYGHITVIGQGVTVDWRTVNPSNIKEKAAAVKAAGGLIGIAHPYRIGYPICTGGSDEWNLGYDYSSFTHYEVWSYLSPYAEPTNVLSLKRYYELCDAGNRLACVYGRDWHSPRDKRAYAATYIGMEGEPSKDKAIAAVRNLTTYISTGITAEIFLNNSSGAAYHIGSEVPKGEYILSITAGYSSREYKEKYGIHLERLRVHGSAAEEFECGIEPGKTIEIKIQLKKGILAMEMYGEAEGRKALLLVSTPFFIK